jgi:hypothetical protein
MEWNWTEISTFLPNYLIIYPLILDIHVEVTLKKKIITGYKWKAYDIQMRMDASASIDKEASKYSE